MSPNKNAIDPVLDFIDDVAGRINGARVNITAACDELGQTAPAAVAAPAESTAWSMINNYHHQLERISRSGHGNVHSVARTTRALLGGKVITAVCQATVPPAPAEAAATADAAVAAAEEALAGAHDKLNEAVAQEDLDAIMTLRPRVEVLLPTRVDQAKLSAADARLTLTQAVHAAAAGYRAAAARRVNVNAAVGNAVMSAEAALDSAAGAVRTNQARRDELAAQVRTQRQRRLRDLAGLSKPEAAPQASQPAAPSSTFGKGAKPRDLQAVQRERAAEFKRSQQRAAGFVSERREGAGR